MTYKYLFNKRARLFGEVAYINTTSSVPRPMTSVQNMEGSERSGYVRLVDVGRRLSKGFDNYRDQYGFVFLSLALLLYCSKSGPKLCLINKLSLEEPVLNVTLYQDSFFSIAPSNRYWYADVSGNELFITTGDFGTRLEIRDWGRSGVTGGSYAEILGEALCCESDCPPVTSSGDYVGIPTKYTLASKVVVMYTIFLLPDLEERARDCVFTTLTNVHSTRVQNLWDTVIEHFCTQLYVVLATAVAAVVLSVRDALKLRTQSSLRSQEPTQSEDLGTLTHLNTMYMLFFCSQSVVWHIVTVAVLVNCKVLFMTRRTNCKK